MTSHAMTSTEQFHEPRQINESAQYNPISVSYWSLGSTDSYEGPGVQRQFENYPAPPCLVQGQGVSQHAIIRASPQAVLQPLSFPGSGQKGKVATPPKILPRTLPMLAPAPLKERSTSELGAQGPRGNGRQLALRRPSRMLEGLGGLHSHDDPVQSDEYY